MSDLHAVLRRRKIAVFVDLRSLAKGLRARKPLAVARRLAEYVLIDNRRVPLGFDEQKFILDHLDRVHHTRNGMGYSQRHVRRAQPDLPMPAGAPNLPPAAAAGLANAVPRRDRQPDAT